MTATGWSPSSTAAAACRWSAATGMTGRKPSARLCSARRQPYEGAAYSITSSAKASSVAGTSMFIARCGFQIHNEAVLRRLFDRKHRSVSSIENPSDKSGDTVEHLSVIGAVGHQSAVSGNRIGLIDCGYPAFGGEVDERAFGSAG